MKSILFIIIVALSNINAGQASEERKGFDVRRTTIVVPVEDGMDAQSVEDSLLSKAAELNMKFVGHQPLSAELRARGLDSPELQIFQFCNPLDAKRIVEFDMTFAAYLPCRIVLVEKDGRLYLTTIDLEILIQNIDLPPDLLAIARRVKRNLQEIMDAGATGDF